MEKPNNLETWLSRIEFHPEIIKLGLERIRPVAERLGLTTFSCPVVMVAGTNGKGTVVNLLSEIYFQSGYRVGAYTSPHLWSFNERIQVQRTPVSDGDLCQAFTVIEDAREEIPLTYFEFTTLAALWHFQQAKLDVLVLEIGLGGRLDAVNIVDHDLAVVTSIGLDHQSYLGETRDAIAIEKAGILRAGKPVVIGDPNPPKTLIKKANALADPVLLYGRDFDDAPLKSLSLVQSNLACVWEVVKQLQSRVPVSLSTVLPSLKHFSVPGRCEIVCRDPLIIRDVSHNADSFQNLANFLNALPTPKRRRAVFSCYRDKLTPTLLSPLLPLIDEWHIAPLAETRGASIDELTSLFGHHPHVSYPDIPTAFDVAKQASQPDDQLIVLGSFAVVGIIDPI